MVFLNYWHRCADATKVGLLAVALAFVYPWLSFVLGVATVWIYTKQKPLDFEKHRALWFFMPIAASIIYLSHGASLPQDDLLRHITAWRLGFDYRAQYPWSDLPKTNLWIGFDYSLGFLQKLGLSKEFLLQWIPGLLLILQSLVLFGALSRAMPRKHHNTELFLLMGALGTLLITPRSLLGRPEMLLLIFGAAAWLCRTKWQAIAWILGYLLLVPVYWLGWVYAACAVLLAPSAIKLGHRIGIAVCLSFCHLAFWQGYSGDYLGLMIWLRQTLGYLALENYPLAHSLSSSAVWIFCGVLGFTISRLNKRRALVAAPVFLLVLWFCLPNQIRYLSSIVFIAIPWIYSQLAVAARQYNIKVPAIVVLLSLGVVAALNIHRTEGTVPKFKLDSNARVYSQSPYATVFYGDAGISVEPSFAIGASYPQWREMTSEQALTCEKLQSGNFTHLVEKSMKTIPDCLTLAKLDNEWRLWRVNYPTSVTESNLSNP